MLKRWIRHWMRRLTGSHSDQVARRARRTNYWTEMDGE